MLDYFALFMLVFVAVVLFYGIIALHDIPYEIAKHREHPHQDAIHVAGWVSLFTLHVIWPFLWIWATLYKPGYGWGMLSEIDDIEDESRQLKEEIAHLRQRLDQLEQSNREEG